MKMQIQYMSLSILKDKDDYAEMPTLLEKIAKFVVWSF